MRTQKRFFVAVDAGHGGRHPKTQEYVTEGKQFYHPNRIYHEGGHYYEGVENRIVANLFMDLLKANGIEYLQTHHDWRDDAGDLQRRAILVNKKLDMGYTGYLQSFHSDASDNQDARGYTIYTTEGQTYSDTIASKHFEHIQKACPNLVATWKWRTETRPDGDVDKEKNFYIIRETKCPAFLEEFGFHTSLLDTDIIVSHRRQRAEAALQTALFVQAEYRKMGLIA